MSNLLDPTILFFFLGVLATLVKSDLELPAPIPRFLAYYLLMALGLKGGFELAHTHFALSILKPLLAAILFSAISPIYLFFIFKKKMGSENAAAIAATYGSVSAVTFITAVNYLETHGINYGGYMVATMALMESPAIIVGLSLAFTFSKKDDEQKLSEKLKHAGKEAMTNGSVFLLMGSLLIAYFSKPGADISLDIFLNGLFKGMLCLFLLDMGLIAAKRFKSLRKQGLLLITSAMFIPLVHGLLALGLAYLLQLSSGDALLLGVLFASGSYIAVPAAFRAALPKADPGLFVPMSLAITFPFNIVLGIPLYMYLVETLF